MSELDRLRALPPEDAKELLIAYAKENDRLHRRLQELVKELAEAKGTDAYKQLEIELGNVQERLAGMQRKMFGDSSERRPKENAPTKKKPKTGHGPRPQPNLPIEHERYLLGEEDRTCPKCGGYLEELKGVTEDADVIDMVERHFVLKHRRCQKYGCGCTIHTAPRPVENIKGGRYTLQFAVGVALAKYADHAPLTRQCRIMRREGLEIDSQTLWDQIEVLAQHLVPAYDKLREYILGADVVGADETWWRLMGGGKGKARPTKRWWAWSLTTPDAVWHGIAPSRSAEAAKEYVGDFEGTLVVDGYKAYDTLAKDNKTLKLAHCWAHARRKFVEAEPNHPECGEALDLIGQLFEVDRGTRDPTLLEGDAKLEAAQERLAKRSREAPPLLDKLRAWALQQRGLPKSGLRKAIDYMFRYWDGLLVFVEDPFVPLDNNGTERALRGMVIGRKNHYGSRSVRGTEVAALFYSLLETANLNGVDPADYLYTAAIFALDFSQALLPWEFAALPDPD